MQKTGLALSMGLVAGLGVLGGAALAAPGDDDTITACLNPKGSVRIVDDPGRCRNSETVLTWNQQGPAGPPGPAGPQGPAGDAGVVASYTIEETLEVAGGTTNVAVLRCDDGDTPISGGFHSSDPRVVVNVSRPRTSSDGTPEWEFQATHDDPIELDLDLYAVCVATS